MSLAGQQGIESEKNTVVIMPYESREECYIEELGEIKKKVIYSFFKRTLDIVFSLFALLLMIIPMAVIAFLIKCTSPGSILYHQERLGLHGKKINVIKFRTMCEDAEKDGVQWSAGDKDPRITPLGRFMRTTHIDELPQFWCILKGDMSLVGPRPEREVYYDEFEQYIHGFRERLKVKPGLTGLAQVRGGYFLKPEKKILYDIEYIKNRSLWLDIKILFETVRVVLTREGAK